MVKKTSDFVRARVLEMYHFIKSCRKVSKNLAQDGISVSAMTVNNIINAKEKKSRKKIFQQETEQEPWKATKKEHSGWPPKILCAIGVCHRGSTSLQIVSENVKVNNEVFLREILISIWKKDISRLYPDEERKVILPMNDARAFFHPNVVQWLETNAIKYVLARYWPTNSSVLSPMEYRMHEICKKC